MCDGSGLNIYRMLLTMHRYWYATQASSCIYILGRQSLPTILLASDRGSDWRFVKRDVVL